MEEKKIIASEKDIEVFNKTLTSFTTSIQERIIELRELSGEEVVVLNDSRSGIVAECHSRKIPANELLTTTIKAFTFLKSQRKKPDGMRGVD